MKIQCTLVLTALVALAGCNGEFQFSNGTVIPEARIVGGHYTGKPVPFMAALVEMVNGKGTASCTATYLGGPWILTAAHCLPSIFFGKVYLGTYDIRKPTFVANIIGTHTPKDWNGKTEWKDTGDIALIKMDKIPPKNNPLIKPICLEGGRRKVVGFAVTAMGWGKEKCDGASSLKLKQTWGEGVVCQHKQMSRLKKVCGLFDAEGIVAKGDSGGPLLVQKKGEKQFQVGVFSTNYVDPVTQCPMVDYDVAYTRIAPYVDWITSIYAGVCTDRTTIKPHIQKGSYPRIPVEIKEKNPKRKT